VDSEKVRGQKTESERREKKGKRPAGRENPFVDS
jgi:ribosomal protein S13